MLFWTADMIAKERSDDQRFAHGQCLTASEPCVSDDRPLRQRRAVGRLQALSVWVGYRMIGLGSRLARPGVVAEARARL
jgi:hypothetical protein